MPSPFPGIDPYLERYWGDVHHRFCTYICDAIQPQIRPALMARIEERLVIETERPAPRSMYPDMKTEVFRGGRPIRGGGGGVAVAGVAEPLMLHYLDDQPRTEGFIQILDPKDGNAVVTVIEILSPVNKRAGRDHDAYRRKQDHLQDVGISLVEIDLLRAGRWTVQASRGIVPPSRQQPYRACVHRGRGPMVYEFYQLPLRERLPKIGIPLREGDADAVVDLQAVVDQVYLNGAYESIRYDVPPEPPLDPDDEAWADGLLVAAGLRKSAGRSRPVAARRKPKPRKKP